jgi:prepilin-type N-terminal cleavage/methylation domain-containing protein/prepilin-type processing-associated H-X9-DG protein
MTRRKGFTLIELLVVIAIIAILAAMLFPVFARARESARKIQCLANVKNIATAVQMYLTDYDRFPPRHTDAAAAAALNEAGPRGLCEQYPDAMFYYGNPFLRWQVILDEYTKNRQVWSCPSAQRMSVPTFIVPHYTPVWYQYLVDNAGKWGQNAPNCIGGFCCVSWPPGWGGTVTDSIGQQQRGSEETGALPISIGYAQIEGRKTSEITDPSWLVVCGDVQGGPEIETAWVALYATSNPCCCLGFSEEDACRYMTDPSFRKRYTPHMGGANFGFADGHAAWWDAEAVLVEAGAVKCCAEETGYSDCYWKPDGKLHGFCPWRQL